MRRAACVAAVTLLAGALAVPAADGKRRRPRLVAGKARTVKVVGTPWPRRAPVSVAPLPAVLTPVASPSPPSLAPAAPVVLPAAPSCGTAVGIAAREWALALTRASVCAGPVVVQARNDGEDDHDLKVLRDGALVASFPVLHPGEGETRALDLTPGAYELLCSLTGGEPPSAASHAEAGMRAVLSAAAAPG